MPILRGRLAYALLYLSSFGLAQSSDQLAAEGVLGPRWKQITRAAGMIFSGTVLEVSNKPVTESNPIPTIEAKFRVSRAIAGVQAGQVLTVREWASAGPTQRGMQAGQQTLLFFYPASSLGLTSPVAGPVGQVPLDASGRFVIATTGSGQKQPSPARGPQHAPVVQSRVSLDQLERAIRSVREGRE